jgi:hypothetical protein
VEIIMIDDKIYDQDLLCVDDKIYDQDLLNVEIIGLMMRFMIMIY